jgi:DNA-binding protein YbaB
MFDKFKDLNQLRKLKSVLGEEEERLEENGVEVLVSGEMKIKEIKLNYQLEAEEQATLLRDLINRAFQEVQKKVAAKMKEGMF